MLWRRLLVAALIPYVAWLVFAYEYHLVDGVNLAAHEAGHMAFRFFGQWPHFLGGSIGQLVFPVAFVVHFARRRQIFEALVMTIWVAESMMYMAEYMGDALALELPLVGGHLHDWNWMLSRLGMLRHCETIAAALHWLASLLAIAAVSYSTWLVRPGQEQPAWDRDDDLDI